MDYKYLITSAGLGSRLGNLCKNKNKALVSIANKPVISHIIDKISNEKEIIIAIGYKGGILKDFIELTYPEKNIKFIYIDKYEGSGSGLGYTILKCKNELQCPFIFISNDTVVLEDIPEPSTNWVAISDDIKDNDKYRSFDIKDGKIKSLLNKQEKNQNSKTYIGLCGIKDYKDFWKELKNGVSYGSIQIGESYSLNKMIKNNIDFNVQSFTWFDAGSEDGIKKCNDYFKKENQPIILDKSDESIWFVNDKVIKFSIDKNFIINRIKRTKYIKNFVPNIISHKENFYVYDYLNGDVISKNINHKTFDSLLKYLNFFWQKVDLNKEEYDVFKNKSLSFYKDKTYDRIQQYLNRYSMKDLENIINNIKIPKIYDILETLNWDELSSGVASNFHGDLHFENILLLETGEFKFIDWRQEFQGIIEYGDIYYDLAKLYHGIIVSHELIEKNLFSVDINDDNIKIDILRKSSLVDIEKLYITFIKENNYDLDKVEILTYLIYLNIAALHHTPYSHFLYYFGKYKLYLKLKELKLL